jgi:hypothetical protein
LSQFSLFWEEKAEMKDNTKHKSSIKQAFYLGILRSLGFKFPKKDGKYFDDIKRNRNKEYRLEKKNQH